MKVDPSYAAWLVDLDGTLYRAAPVRLAMAIELAISGWSAVPTLRAFRKQHERGRGGDTQGDPYRAQLERTAAELNVSEKEVSALVTGWMFERPAKWLRLCKRRSLLKEIVAFRARGGRTALVSDYPARAKLLALNAGELFDQVVAAGEPGGPSRLKPDPEGYLLAARALGVEPERCLVLGDRQDADGEAAEAAGMGFLLIR